MLAKRKDWQVDYVIPTGIFPLLYFFWQLTWLCYSQMSLVWLGHHCLLTSEKWGYPVPDTAAYHIKCRLKGAWIKADMMWWTWPPSLKIWALKDRTCTIIKQKASSAASVAIITSYITSYNILCFWGHCLLTCLWHIFLIFIIAILEVSNIKY